MRVFLGALITVMACTAAHGDLTLLGVQYQEDEYNSDFFCYWDVWDWPTSCKTSGDFPPGATAFVYYKNTGETNITVSDVELEDYSLPTVLYEKVSGINIFHSIWFYWDDPPSAILDAGEPIFYRLEPKDAATLYPGDVGCCAVRLRWVPTTNPIDIDVVTSANTITGTVSIDNTQPRVANVSFTEDRKTVYIHWRRPENTAPATIKIDGTDITSDCTTVNDTDYDFCVTKYTRSTALADMSLHVYEGIWSDSEKAFAGVRTYANRFPYGTYGADDCVDTAESKAFINSCEDRGVNCIVHTMGSDLVDFLDSSGGQTYAAEHNYSAIIDDPHDWGFDPPLQWYLREEPECRDANLGCNDTGLNIPCDYDGYRQLGALSLSSVELGHQRRNHNNVPTMTCIDGWKKPHNYHVYGQVQDMAWADPYYQPRLKNVYWWYNDRIGLFENAKWIYATSRTLAAGAEPYPSGITLYSNEYHEPDTTLVWPYADQACKRIEVYYTLAGGAKAMSYWWFRGYPNGSSWGLMRHDEVQRCGELWDEIGLCGNEIRAARPLLVTSHPVDDMTVTGSTDVWVKGLASGIDSLILIAVNDDYYVDSNGDTQISDITNATVTVTLPTWMQSPTPSAFTIHRHGCKELSSSIDGEDMEITIGTLDVARIIVVTTDSTKFQTYKYRYLDECWEGICTFSSSDCLVPNITSQPDSAGVGEGATVIFSVTAGGATPLTYQWQKDGTDLSNGGQISGVTTTAVTITDVDSTNEGDYTCVVTNSYDNVTSDVASLEISCGSANVLQNSDFEDGFTSGIANNWTTYAVGGITPTFLSGNGNPSPGQRADCSVTRDTRIYGIRQLFDAAVGDAYTFTADVWCISNSNNANCNLRINWAGSTLPAESSQICNADQPAQTWTQLNYGSGVSQSTSLMLFADMRGYTDSNVDTDTYWDNFLVYRAYMPPGPTVTKSTTSSTTLDVDVRDGCNSSNSNAQFAITIDGGAYTEGTHWIQANGTVGTSTVWQTNATWGIKAVTGLTTGVEYTFKAKARYSSSLTEASSLGAGASETPSSVITFTTQPSGQNKCAGATATFTVAATGEGTLSYQWQKDASDLANGGDVSGVTTTTLTIVNVDASDEGSYRCVVTDSYGSANSDTANLNLKTATNVTQDPSAQDVCTGSTAEFFVYADGEGEMLYQWQKDSSDISDGAHYLGTETATLNVLNADSGDLGNYRCIVTAECGSDTSATGALTLKDATSITDQPDPTSTGEGGTATFTVAATGEGTLTYQWQKTQSDLSNGGHYSGVTTATLMISNADSGDEANYRCVVTGDCGSATSNEAALTISGSVTVTQHPSPQDVCAGATAQFTVTASGTSLTYQWQKNQSDLANGGDISGATTDTLSIANVDGSDEANYRCVVNGDGGSDTSNEAALTLKDATAITGQPDNESIEEGDTATFTVSATGEGTLTYQWQKDQSDMSNGGDISGVTTATLTIENIDSSDEANYRCVVTGQCGSTASNEASLEICPAPSLSNGGFESGFTSGVGNNWTTYVQTGATATFSEGTSSPPEGDSYQVILINLDPGDPNKHAGVYQTITGIINGNTYTISGYYRTDTKWNSDIVSLLVDTDGGTDYASAEETVASKTGNSSGTDPYSDVFTTFSGDVTATGTSMTIFLDVEMDDVASGHIGAFDAITITGCATAVPTITSQPSAQDLCAGATATFSVSATGEGTITYQWQKAQSDLSNGGDISGATTSTLTIANVESGDAANYRCVVSNSNGDTNSNEAALTLKDATTITAHPSNDVVDSGGTATFTVSATGEGTLTYQWQKAQSDLSNGGHYSGVTTATLTVSNADSGDEANYRCVVTGECDSATSNEASLTLIVCGAELSNEDFEDGFTSGVANDWTSYTGSGTWTFSSASGNPGSAQQLDNADLDNSMDAGIYQTIDAGSGDAFTFSAQARCSQTSAKAELTLRVDWAGGTSRPGSALVTASQGKNSWTQLPYGSGNATSTSVTLFCDVAGTKSNGSATETRWDNVVVYHAFVPLAPTVSSASSTSLNVDVNAGCNYSNSSAQYAITIDGGAYTEGTHWVQANGSVSTGEVWQTDSTWGTTEVTGLTTSTQYTFKVKARYSSTYTEDTSLGTGANGTP